MNRFVSVLAMCLLLLSGCTRQPAVVPVSHPEPVPPPEPPQILSVALSTGIAARDPALALSSAELTLVNCLYEGLARLDDSGSPQPALAREWSSADGGYRWQVSLRPGLEWSTGDPLTAADVKDGWLRLLDPDLHSPWAYLLQSLERIETSGPLELEIRFSQPVLHFGALIAHPALFPCPLPGDEGPASGPYAVAGTHPGGLVLVPNPRYWDRDRVRVTELLLYDVASAREGLRLFLDGTVDLVDHAPEVEQQWLDDRGWLRDGPDRATYLILINSARGPLADPRVRQSLSLALDREWLTGTVIRGRELPARGFVPPGFVDPVTGRDFRDVAGDVVPRPDPASARRLLAEAGYPGGRGFPELEALTNASEFHRAVLLGLSRWWERELGLEPLTIAEYDWTTYLQLRQAGEFDLARAGWGADYPDPMAMLEPFLPGGKFSSTGWHSPEFVDEVARATAPDRISVLAAAEAILAAELPAIPVFHYRDSWLARPSISGVLRHPIGPSFCLRDVRVVEPR